MKKRLVWFGVICLLATTAVARDLEDILKDKGVIDATEANEAKASNERKQAATDKALASIPPLPEWLRMVTLFGDVRIRNETFFQDGTKDRIRQRFRLRIGAKINPTDEMEFGFKLASGNANDPISNNQTFTDEFTFKNINIANAYVKLSPSHSIGLDRPWVTVVGGKFDQPFYVPRPRTSSCTTPTSPRRASSRPSRWWTRRRVCSARWPSTWASSSSKRTPTPARPRSTASRV